MSDDDIFDHVTPSLQDDLVPLPLVDSEAASLPAAQRNHCNNGMDEQPRTDDEADEESFSKLPEEVVNPRPTLSEYKLGWDTKFAQHSKKNEQPFGDGNLCPIPVPQLWQDAPHVPFHELKSSAAQGRLALVRPISGLQESTVIDGVEKYAHMSGDVPCDVFRNEL